MVNDINEIINDLAKIDNASAMIMESTQKEKHAYAKEIKQKTKDFDEKLLAEIDERVTKLRTSLSEENKRLIEQCKIESNETIQRMDLAFTAHKEEWVNSIFSNIVKG